MIKLSELKALAEKADDLRVVINDDIKDYIDPCDVISLIEALEIAVASLKKIAIEEEYYSAGFISEDALEEVKKKVEI